MRKKQGHEKQAGQLSLFTAQEVSLRPQLETDSGTEPNREGESNHFSLLARNRAFTETLLEAVMSPTNLNRAYERVRRNGGASGVDAMDIKGLKDWLGINVQDLIDQVLKEGYKPEQVLGVEIPKPNGGVRLLGIPNLGKSPEWAT